jgi:lauroyl/myristoyl acyltransferase
VSNEAVDLDAALAAAAQRSPRPAMPPAELRVRLKTSPALRRLLPTRLAVARAEAVGRARWEDADARRDALRATNAIVAGTARAGDAEQLARQRLIEDEVGRVLFWQPWGTTLLDERSAENLAAAYAPGRPVLLSMCHVGPYFLAMSALTSRGYHEVAMAAPWFFAPPSHDYWGRRIARWWRGIYPRHERVISTAGGFALFKALLERGETLLIYFDMPGSRATSFLGKQVMLGSGSSQLAFQTSAVVLPLRARRDGHRVWTDVMAPLDARDFADADQLHDALAAVHERSILEHAESLEDPNRSGAWEEGASERGWAKPRPGDSPRPSDAPRPGDVAHEETRRSTPQSSERHVESPARLAGSVQSAARGDGRRS